MIDDLLKQGDDYFKEKNYNLANASYESVFLLDPEHLGASKRIDVLKKQLLKEGKSETDLIGRVYDSEIEIRVSSYLKQAHEFIDSRKWAQARLAVQKALLMSPLNEEAKKLYHKIGEQLEPAVE